MSILIIGLSAVGKSYIGNELCRLLNLTIYNMGELMRQCSYNEEKSVEFKRKKACLNIGQNNNNKNIIISIHAFVKFDNEYYASISEDDLKSINAQAIILVEANPKIIIERRIQDKLIRPDRTIENQENILRLQNLQHDLINNLSILSKVPLLCINNDGHSDILKTVIPFIKKIYD